MRNLVLIAAPVGADRGNTGCHQTALASGSIVTDAAVTKGDVVACARKALGEKIAQFVPGHPIAGRELNGSRCGDCGFIRWQENSAHRAAEIQYMMSRR